VAAAAVPLPPSIALIACRVLDNEIAAFAAGATHIVRQEFFEMGLHDHPAGLRAQLAEAIKRAEEDPAVQAIVLVYGLCGLALAELAPRRCRLVVPRAHDCLTLFLGSKERYAAWMQAEPGTYWYAPGWNRERRVPGPERDAQLRAAFTEKFGAADAEALLALDRESFAHHTCAAYVDFGLPGDAEHRRYAEGCAAALGWRFAPEQGDAQLLRDLLHGPWDSARFLVVQPGERIAFSPDAAIVKAVPIALPTPTCAP
jgi:hypothetical protein